MYNARNSNASRNSHTSRTDLDRRNSCFVPNLNQNHQLPQFDERRMSISPEILQFAELLVQAQRGGFAYGFTPDAQMHERCAFSEHTVRGLQDSSRRYSYSAQNLVFNNSSNQSRSQANLNNSKQCRLPQNTKMVRQSANVTNRSSAGLVHGKCYSAQDLNLVARREMVAPSPMKRARLRLKFSNLPSGFAVEDVIQKILGTDKVLLLWHGRPDIRLVRDKNGGSSYCIAQFINEMEAEKVRVFWNGTEIVKGEGKLIVEYSL